MIAPNEPDPAGRPAVRVRPARPADAPLLHTWRGEPSVRKYQPLTEATIAELRADLARQHPEELHRGHGDRFQWIVVVAGEPAGWITLAIASWDHGIAEVGYALSEPFQGRGVMTAALGDLLVELFGQTAIERIEARCAIDNAASRAVLEKLGFEREGLLRGYFELDGVRVDNWLFAILRSDLIGPRRAAAAPQAGSRLA